MDHFKSQIIHVVNTVDKLNFQERLEALSYLQKITEAYKNNPFPPDLNLNSQNTECSKSLNKNFKHKCKNQLCLTNNIKHLKKIVCFKCDKRLDSEFLLFEHSHTHLDYPLSCSFCRCVFRNIEDYNSHKDCNQCLQKYVCKVCQNSFLTKKTFQSHSLDNHGVKLYNNWYGCKLCHEMFEQKKSLYHHYKEAHPELKCQLNPGPSELSQTNNTNLTDNSKTHEVKNEDVNEEKFQCLHCSKIFQKKSRLSVHMKRHLREKEYVCKLCKKKFAVYRNYRRHLKCASHQNKEGHDNQPLFKCEICGKLFASRDSLTRHQLRLHLTSDKRLKCPLCDFKTSLGTSLSRHINLHTENRKFICDQCGSCFHTFSALKEHTVYVHSNERNYSCEICGQRFKLKSGLNRHFKTHSNEKEFKCFCGQIYKFRTNLKRHLLVAHKIVGEKKNVMRVTNEEEGYVMNSPRVVKKKTNKRNKDSTELDKIDDFDISSFSALSDVDLSCADEVLRETYNSFSKYSAENSESQENFNSILAPAQLIDQVLRDANEDTLKSSVIDEKSFALVGESTHFVDNSLPVMGYRTTCRQYLNCNFGDVLNQDYASQSKVDSQFMNVSLNNNGAVMESYNRQYNPQCLSGISVEDETSWLNGIYDNH